MSEKNCILVVDDDEGTRKSLTLLLKRKGFDTESAETGKEALAIAQGRRISLTLLDMKLPDIMGTQLLAPLKGTNPDMSIIMITGFASVESAVQSLTAGASGYITKPIDLDGMLARIKTALDQQHLVTEVRQAEDALRQSEEKFRGIFDTINDGIHIHTIEPDGKPGKFIEMNEVACRMLQYTREELLNIGPLDIVSGDHSRPLSKIIGELSSTGHAIFETGHRRKDGTVIPVEINAHIVNLLGKRMTVSAIRDITERKQAERELASIQVSLNEAYKLAHIGTWDWIIKTDRVTWSEELYHIAGRDPSLPAPTYAEHSRIYKPTSWELLSVAVTRAITTNEPYNLELELVRPDGSIRWVIAFGDVKRDWEEKVIGLYGTVQDIADRKQAEEEIRALNRDLEKRVEERTTQLNQLLAEKETLLREIHHRVKNNLQIISSMLNMQVRKLDDPKTIETLRDSQNRVLSMALVHEHLYRGKDFSHIDLKNYIAALAKGLFQSYEAENEGIRLDLNIRDIFVDINTAIPLGLITNELITNSLKYAFKGRKEGKISILATEDPQCITFVVADNGPGMPEGITLENQTTLGLRLVHTLTGQLHGTVSIDRSEGTKFVFMFPKPAETPGKAGP